MRLRLAFVTLVALAAWAPAHANSYVGYFHGIITAGSIRTWDPSIWDYHIVDLSGVRLTGSWQAISTANAPSPSHPSETVPLLQTNTLWGIIGSDDPYQDYWNNYSEAGYSGNELAGHFNVGNRGNSSFAEFASFSFGTGLGGMTGSGDYLYRDESGFNYDSGVNFSFNITSGVAFAVVPEPMTWSLMILGFGAAGGALRRHRSASPVTYG